MARIKNYLWGYGKRNKRHNVQNHFRAISQSHWRFIGFDSCDPLLPETANTLHNSCGIDECSA